MVKSSLVKIYNLHTSPKKSILPRR